MSTASEPQKKVDEKKVYTGLKLIGAGFGRTGTSSFRVAMDLLDGYGPCYHMLDNQKHHDSKFWARAGRHELVNFDDVFGRPGHHYMSSVDNPSSMCWEQQLKQYPNAKVVLTTRDFESWYQSCKDTIFKMFPGSPYAPEGNKVAFALGLPHSGFEEMVDVLLFPSIGGSWKKADIKKTFDAYHAHVKVRVSWVT